MEGEEVGPYSIVKGVTCVLHMLPLVCSIFTECSCYSASKIGSNKATSNLALLVKFAFHCNMLIGEASLLVSFTYTHFSNHGCIIVFIRVESDVSVEN